MRGKIKFVPEKIVRQLEGKLENFIESLDADNYPESLRNSLAKLLTKRGSRRVSALACAAFASENDRELDIGELVVLEIILTGLLLTADFAALDESSNAETPAAALAAQYGDALVLLAADTLLTLPYESLGRFADKIVSRMAASTIANAVVVFLGRIMESAGVPPPGLLAAMLAAAGVDSGLIDGSITGLLEQIEYAEWFGSALPELADPCSARGYLTAVLEYLKV